MELTRRTFFHLAAGAAVTLTAGLWRSGSKRIASLCKTARRGPFPGRKISLDEMDIHHPGPWAG